MAYPYDDQTGARIQAGSTVLGVPTIGYGFTFLTKEEADAVLQLRLSYIIKYELPMFPEVKICNDARLLVVISMIYQLGHVGYSKFKRMREAILNQDWQKAHDECLDSHAFKFGLPGVKKRFQWYAETLLKGER